MMATDEDEDAFGDLASMLGDDGGGGGAGAATGAGGAAGGAASAEESEPEPDEDEELAELAAAFGDDDSRSESVRPRTPHLLLAPLYAGSLLLPVCLSVCLSSLLCVLSRWSR
jgi:hypothetical protein